jgi:hypothetical protein
VITQDRRSTTLDYSSLEAGRRSLPIGLCEMLLPCPVCSTWRMKTTAASRRLPCFPPVTANLTLWERLEDVDFRLTVRPS